MSDAIAARSSSTGTPRASARATSTDSPRSVSNRPGETAFTRTAGASARASAATSAATPGRSTFDASSPGIGFRVDDDATNTTDAPSENFG